MIVDDDRITVSLLQTLLEMDGFEVMQAPNGAIAMERAKANKPDAFLVDFHLADYDGSDFVRELRKLKEFADAPIIMTSGLNREKEAAAAGANKFLIKPFEPSNLVSLLNEMLAQNRKG
jgi:DNA-binding response OmpR family regulator